MNNDKKPKNLHAGHRQRLRDSVLKNGLNNMHDHQVLEFLLSFVVPQKDTNEIAHRLINEFGSFAGVLEGEIDRLKSVKGIGEVVAHFLFNQKNFFQYYQTNKLITYDDALVSTYHTKRYFKALLSNKQNEELYLVGLDNHNKVVYCNMVERGSSNRTSANIRKITNIIINNSLSNVIIAHNHPNGSCHPSIDDDRFTKKLFLALSTNDVSLLDHIIVGQDDMYSYCSSGEFEKYRVEFKDVVNTSLAKSNYNILEGGDV